MRLASRLRIAPILSQISHAYRQRLEEFGESAQGVIWNDEDGQRLRFEVLSLVFADDPSRKGVSVNDLGCGYGALFDFLAREPILKGGQYSGYDICARMIEAARERVGDPRATFQRSAVATQDADYSLVSGTFNLKLKASPALWHEYVTSTLAHLWSKTRRGMAFNILDGDPGDRDDMFYHARPGPYVDFCREALGGKVVLVDDYPLKEWTLLVRR